MVITILALTLCLTTVALFPIDIYLVSRIMDSATGLRYEWATDAVIAHMQDTVRIVYYGKYFFSFRFFLPVRMSHE